MPPDCPALRSLIQVPPDRLNDYLQCMEAPAAGPVPEQAVSLGVGVGISIIVLAVACAQLVGLQPEQRRCRGFWGCALVGALGYLAAQLL